MELEKWGHTVHSDTYRYTNTHMETYTPHTHVQEREKKINCENERRCIDPSGAYLLHLLYNGVQAQ